VEGKESENLGKINFNLNGEKYEFSSEKMKNNY
jgi:hypothetical protein